MGQRVSARVHSLPIGSLALPRPPRRACIVRRHTMWRQPGSPVTPDGAAPAVACPSIHPIIPVLPGLRNVRRDSEGWMLTYPCGEHGDSLATRLLFQTLYQINPEASGQLGAPGTSPLASTGRHRVLERSAYTRAHARCQREPSLPLQPTKAEDLYGLG
ncbi:hypothetical protein PYCCODRAFT_506383 [Trametes coccinea BRFM310]|uniref:Uncharacterized protein n=1 Tax=Trametes coccinea (strain BRFM310) TaxID=1353009 RepID=A0A1Y2IMB0_TRAC3|nr:hypothetical protein PYCCODRAFT_506383 [Trametes coccinea BRFM310]